MITTIVYTYLNFTGGISIALLEYCLVFDAVSILTVWAFLEMVVLKTSEKEKHTSEEQ